MHVPDKVIPPKIVQPNPLSLPIWLTLLLLGFALVGGFAYDYGTRHASDPGEAGLVRSAADQGKLQALQLRIDELVAENARLRLRSETPAQPPEPGPAEAAPEVPRVEPESAPRASGQDAAEADAGDAGRLWIADLRLNPGAEPRMFSYAFKVGREGAGDGDVSGSIWIAVNGLSGGKPLRLPLKKVSDKQASFVKMRFKKLQLVEGDISLPEGFTPKNMIVEAKPTNGSYDSVAETMAWSVTR